MVFLFIDTNVLLHFRTLEEVDWRALFGSDVTLVVSPIVLKELERQKVLHPQKKIRKRAQNRSQFFVDRILGNVTDPIREGVFLQFINREPQIDFDGYRLDPYIADDRLIATVLDWRIEHPSSDARLFSDDAGVLLKGKVQNIPVVRPSDNDRLPQEDTLEEQRIKELESQLRDFKNVQPALKLHFAEGGGHLRALLKSVIPLDDAAIRTEIERVRAAFPLLPIPENAPPIAQFELMVSRMHEIRAVDPRVRLRRKNAQIEKYFQEYEKYLRDRYEFQNLLQRSFLFDVVIVNDGSGPADDLDTVLTFPENVSVFDDDDPPKAPEEPDEPSDRSGSSHWISEVPAVISTEFLRGIGPITAKVSTPKIVSVSGKVEMLVHVKRVKHGSRVSLGKLILAFKTDELVQNISVSYTISAANIRTKLEGILSIIPQRPK